MKRFLSITLYLLSFTFMGLSHYAIANTSQNGQETGLQIDQAATAAAPWLVGATTGDGVGDGMDDIFVNRVFLGVTTDGYYLVQDFYKQEDGASKFSDPFTMLKTGAVDQFIDDFTSIVGKYVTWYENGEKRSELSVKNGELDGLRVHWYPNGQQMMERHFVRGKEQGPSKSWHINGQLSEEGEMVDGKNVGIWRSWDEQGKLISEHDYGSAE